MPGSGQMDFADVKVKVDIGVGDPVRMVKPERHLSQTAPQWLQFADQRGELGVHRRVRVEVGARASEDHQSRHMAERRRRLHRALPRQSR